jgi:hypothetical protein
MQRQLLRQRAKVPMEELKVRMMMIDSRAKVKIKNQI